MWVGDFEARIAYASLDVRRVDAHSFETAVSGMSAQPPHVHWESAMQTRMHDHGCHSDDGTCSVARCAAAASATARGAAGVGGGEAENNSGFALFEVEITLTAAGLHAGPGLGLAAVRLLFQYLQMLKAAGPQEWVWQESKLISDCKFRCVPA